ncbi:hypothetical protein HDU97_006681 [Phlyctochytrium planicorne]|nr:hypothetical protein HDU97_006681 [Phlyctochytrium planicorne]
MSLEEKIGKFESFLNDRLKPDLEAVLEKRDGVFDHIAEYTKLQAQIELMESTSGKDIKALVDVGSNFFMQARVPKGSQVFVGVDTDTFLALSYSEALTFIAKKEKSLQRRADALTKQAVSLKAQIKFVLATVQQILETED